MMIETMSGLPSFLLFFGIATGLVAVYLLLYTLATAHNEFALIRQNVISAAVALGFSLVGFALPLGSAIVHAQNILDCLVWGLVALVVQILAYWLVRALLPDLSKRIAAGEMASALFLGAASLAAGIVNAAAMTF
jgi:putative membrane protein